MRTISHRSIGAEQRGPEIRRLPGALFPAAAIRIAVCTALRTTACWVIRVTVSAALAAGLSAALPSTASADKNYHHPEISMTIAFGPDGTAEVDEVRTFRFKGSFSWAYLKKSLEGRYGSCRVEYLGVSDAGSGEPLRHELSREGDYEIIKWRYRARNETRRFRIRYRIHDAVQRYGDAAQFYWKVIGDEHERIDRLSVTLLPPAASESLLKVFVHGPPLGELEIADDRTRAVVHVEGVPRNRFVEIRALMDPSLFERAPLQTGESYASLLKDERRITEQFRLNEERRIERARRRGRELTAALIIGAAAALLFTVVYIHFFRRYGREFDVGYEQRYERDPPRDLAPCYLPAIMTQSGARDEEMGKAFVAALLECARLGLLEISERAEKGLLFKQKELEYELTARGREILAGSGDTARGDSGRDGAGDPGVDAGRGHGRLPRRLTFFERDVLAAVFSEAGDGSKVTGDELKKWSTKRSGSRTKFYQFARERGKRLRSEFERRYFKLDDQESERAKKRFLGIAVLIALAPAAGFILVTRNPVILLLSIPLLIVAAFLTLPLARRTREAALEHKRWTAFRRFMSDFSAMKEAGPSLLPLWEHYLVYAAALGVADKLLKNLELVARESGTAVPAAVWFHPALAGGAGGAAAGAAAFGSVSASIANLQALSSALSTTTSSGGGFSGGGGGGGGGGGSGAG